MAYLQSSNKSFAVYRNFLYLCSRVLVQKQVELDDIEKQLKEQDSVDDKSDLKERRDRLRSAKYSRKTQTTGSDVAQDAAQPELIQVTYEKLKEYSEHSILRLIWFPNANV